MSDRFDQILKQALAPDQTPDLRLNQKILNQVKEREEMKKRMGSRNCVFFCTSAGGGIRSGLCGLQTADAGTDSGKDGR